VPPAGDVDQAVAWWTGSLAVAAGDVDQAVAAGDVDQAVAWWTGSLALLEAHKGHYARWHTELHAGFNLCCYGFGSKRSVLRDFAWQQLTDGPVVEINGFMPGPRLLYKALAT